MPVDPRRLLAGSAGGDDDVEVCEVPVVDGRHPWREVVYGELDPWVHVHAWPGEVDADGRSMIEVCCHACGEAMFVVADAPLSGAAAADRDRIVSAFCRRHCSDCRAPASRIWPPSGDESTPCSEERSTTWTARVVSATRRSTAAWS